MTPPQLLPVPPERLGYSGAHIRETSAANRIVCLRLGPQLRNLVNSRATAG